MEAMAGTFCFRECPCLMRGTGEIRQKELETNCTATQLGAAGSTVLPPLPAQQMGNGTSRSNPTTMASHLAFLDIEYRFGQDNDNKLKAEIDLLTAKAQGQDWGTILALENRFYQANQKKIESELALEAARQEGHLFIQAQEAISALARLHVNHLSDGIEPASALVQDETYPKRTSKDLEEFKRAWDYLIKPFIPEGTNIENQKATALLLHIVIRLVNDLSDAQGVPSKVIDIFDELRKRIDPFLEAQYRLAEQDKHSITKDINERLMNFIQSVTKIFTDEIHASNSGLLEDYEEILKLIMKSLLTHGIISESFDPEKGCLIHWDRSYIQHYIDGCQQRHSFLNEYKNLQASHIDSDMKKKLEDCLEKSPMISQYLTLIPQLKDIPNKTAFIEGAIVKTASYLIHLINAITFIDEVKNDRWQSNLLVVNAAIAVPDIAQSLIRYKVAEEGDKKTQLKAISTEITKYTETFIENEIKENLKNLDTKEGQVFKQGLEEFLEMYQKKAKKQLHELLK